MTPRSDNSKKFAFGSDSKPGTSSMTGLSPLRISKVRSSYQAKSSRFNKEEDGDSQSPTRNRNRMSTDMAYQTFKGKTLGQKNAHILSNAKIKANQ